MFTTAASCKQRVKKCWIKHCREPYEQGLQCFNNEQQTTMTCGDHLVGLKDVERGLGRHTTPASERKRASNE